jgi:hypothetical protein
MPRGKKKQPAEKVEILEPDEIIPPKRGRPRIRPRVTDPGILDRICSGLIEGKSITDVCEPQDMPHWTDVYKEMAKDRDSDFTKAIAHAREAQQEAIIDGTVALADKATVEDVNVVKLRIWARQWRAAKLAPKKYGDKTVTEVTGANGGAIKLEAQRSVVLENLDDESLAQVEQALRLMLNKPE